MVLTDKNNSDNARLWEQFCRLGEMIGDGLHYEKDGKWITKEYRKLAKILIPVSKEESALIRKLKNNKVNSQMATLLENKKCDCGGEIKQKRSGTKVAYCQKCNTRYVARTSNKRFK